VGISGDVLHLSPLEKTKGEIARDAPGNADDKHHGRLGVAGRGERTRVDRIRADVAEPQHPRCGAPTTPPLSITRSARRPGQPSPHRRDPPPAGGYSVVPYTRRRSRKISGSSDDERRPGVDHRCVTGSAMPAARDRTRSQESHHLTSPCAVARRPGRWQHWSVELGVHLPLVQFGDEPLSLGRLEAVVDTARDCGFASISANDHFVFQAPWLDGPTALASMIECSGEMTLATTVSLAVLRGPVPLAKALAAIDVLSVAALRRSSLA
jgi:hypothetical protein